MYDSDRRSLVRQDRNFETKFSDFETKFAASFSFPSPIFLGVACSDSLSMLMPGAFYFAPYGDEKMIAYAAALMLLDVQCTVQNGELYLSAAENDRGAASPDCV